MSSNAKYYEPDPDWEEYAMSHNLPTRTESIPNIVIDIINDRQGVKLMENEWAARHSFSDIGYQTHIEQVRVHDGAEVGIKIYRPIRKHLEQSLPLLFVTHAGGWIFGSYPTDEERVLWSVLQEFDLVVVSVDYRLAPDNPYPAFIEDSWDVLQNVLSRHKELDFDHGKVILAGTSAGGCIAASMAQRCVTKNIHIYGVILNVPVTCDPRHFPADEFEYTSYEQGVTAAMLGGHEMRSIWELVIPDPVEGRKSLISPLLGEVKGLPQHLIFVAGQDPLRDDGIAYAEKLRRNDIPVVLHVYQGVPHNFGKFWELKQTRKFWSDLRQGLKEMLSQ